MHLLLILLLTCYYGYSVYGYLTKPHWNTINNILQSNAKNQIKQDAKDIIFKEHFNWANKHTYKFIQNKNFILSKSQINELKVCCYLGLTKAINRYNGTGNFYIYSCIYMNSELYKGISDITSMKKLPHYLRVSKKWKEKNEETYKKNMIPIRTTHYDKLLYNKENENINIREIIDELPSNERRLFYLRYDFINLKKIRGYERLAELQCCSRHTIQKKFKIINNKIKNQLDIYK